MADVTQDYRDAIKHAIIDRGQVLIVTLEEGDVPITERYRLMRAAEQLEVPIRVKFESEVKDGERRYVRILAFENRAKVKAEVRVAQAEKEAERTTDELTRLILEAAQNGLTEEQVRALVAKNIGKVVESIR